MFAKRRRFEPEKESDIPPPGAYNPEDPQFDSYKKGAISEKADRFCKETDSDIPGPGVYAEKMKPSMKTATKQSSANTNDRYAILQRKLEDLERIHNEEKRSHQAELERLKMELARTQKSNTELTERVGKQAKQGAAYEQRLEEMKRAVAADKAEIKDLATKLRISENQRAQATAKQDGLSDLKKNLHAADARRKEEGKEKDKKIAELEKSLASERKRRDLVEEQLKSKDQETSGLGDSIQTLKREIMRARDEVEEARRHAQVSQAESSSKEEMLLQQLENRQTILEQVTEAYGVLAAGTVSKGIHDELRRRHAILEIQLIRVQRKLANSDSQVSELAHLIRQTKDDHRLLQACLRDAEDMMLSFSTTADSDQRHTEEPLQGPIDALHEELREETNLTLAARLSIAAQETLLLDLAQQNVLALADVQHQELLEAQTQQQDLSLRLQEVQKQRNTAEELLKATTDTANELRVSLETFKRQVSELDAKVEEEKRQSKSAVKKEKENAQRLASLVQKGKMAEDGLRAEVEQLTTELIDAERYQEAYFGLRDHLETLSAHNALAEEEVQKLSAFNAEIIGHHNPAQRILYVERIRNELAETKHKLIASTKTNEAVISLSEDLRQELDMYKSVYSEHRPKTTLTRVARPPLVEFNQSQPRGRTTTGSDSLEGTLPTIVGDMTVDEIF
ncbi:hypothetical protein V5O48_000233 [Marasmius crinis-equi]|uniref:Uncharacterized protein n=1 Tax=Marasmius crinis-equi TaxID=585013 RepID=A0ABR3G2P5_9AGAR